MADEHAPAIEDYLVEDRKFPPPAGFKEHSLVAGTFLYDEADTDYEGFWARQAADLLTWAKDWDTICDWQLPFAKWFVGGSAERRRTTASTVTSRPAAATRSRSTGRASRATPARSPTPTCWPRCSASPTC